MSSVIGASLQKGVKMRDLLGKLRGLQVGGKALDVRVDERGVPYLDDKVDGWVDGPPTSVVAFVLAGADVDGAHWRRWTIARSGPGQYTLGVFPTPFKNGQDPLSPGVPPSSSKRA